MQRKRAGITYVPCRYCMMVLYMLWQKPLHGSIVWKKWILCSGLTQLKHILALGKPLTFSFYLKSFCKYYCNLWADWGIWGLSMSVLTDSFTLSHIMNHLLSTYTVFKAIFSPDGRNVACIKVKSQSHLTIHLLNEMPQFYSLYSRLTAFNKETAL